MKAALIDRYDGPIPVVEVHEPECPHDGAIVEIKACGVCRSDHHAWKGADPDVVLPHVMGHEFAGEVIETGRDCTRYKTGDRVTAPFILGCGKCADCQAGEPTICDQQNVIGFTQWGAFAERMAVPHADYNLVRLPEQLDFVSAAGMGCRVTTAFRALTERGGLKAGEWVAIHGCGGVGLAAIQIARALNAQTIAIDVNQDALDMATALGADRTLNASETDSVGEAVREMTDGGVHVAIDALGIAATFDNGLRSLKKLGRYVQIGMPVGANATVPLPLLELVYARQLTIHGTRGMGAAGFPKLFDLVTAGRFDPARLVTDTICLSEVGAALRAMDRYKTQGVTVINRLDA